MNEENGDPRDSRENWEGQPREISLEDATICQIESAIEEYKSGKYGALSTLSYIAKTLHRKRMRTLRELTHHFSG